MGQIYPTWVGQGRILRDMEPYIQISKINDFLYCPMSLYLHSIYENFTEKTYHQSPQVVGRIRHEAIEAGTYSSSRRFVVGMEVWSETYHLMGKIDIYDREGKALIERKTRVRTIYEGYRYQLYAQYFAMIEMEYPVEKLFVHSLEDNRRYPVALPDAAETEAFARTIAQIRSFSIEDYKHHTCPKCAESIYGVLAW